MCVIGVLKCGSCKKVPAKSWICASHQQMSKHAAWFVVLMVMLSSGLVED